MTDREVTADLMARLRRHYIKPGQAFAGGVFIEECGLNNGSSGQRVDALYVGFTTSSGRLLVGHEVKASRGDWLNELRKVGKADSWADQCHAWWLVTAADVVRPGELPDGWGHMIPGTSKTRMKVLQPAVVDRDRHPSWLHVRSVMARLDTLQVHTVAQLRRDQAGLVETEVEKRFEGHVCGAGAEATTAHNAHRLHQLQELEAALGVTLGHWSQDGVAFGPADLGRGLHAYLAADRDIHVATKRLLRDTKARWASLTEIEEACALLRTAIAAAHDLGQPAVGEGRG